MATWEWYFEGYRAIADKSVASGPQKIKNYPLGISGGTFCGAGWCAYLEDAKAIPYGKNV